MPGFPTKKQTLAEGACKKPPRSELKHKEVILKDRKLKARKQATMKYRTDRHKKNHAMSGRGSGRGGRKR